MVRFQQEMGVVSLECELSGVVDVSLEYESLVESRTLVANVSHDWSREM